MNRRFRQDVKKYTARIATPGSGAFSLPASAWIRFKSVAGCAAETTCATITSSGGLRTLKTLLLAAGGTTRPEWFERGKTLTPAAGFDVMMDKGLGKLVKIGAG